MTLFKAIDQSQSDIFGALASGLCAIHCICTPFLFVAQSCTITGSCAAGPGWWGGLDFFFIAITFIAVYFSAKNSSKQWIKYALYVNCIILSFFVFNEKAAFLPIAAIWKYIASFTLVTLHLYNRKYCRCAGKHCCVD